MKTYHQPILEVIEFASADIVTASAIQPIDDFAQDIFSL